MIQDKAMKLKDGKILYDDLRTRVESKVSDVQTNGTTIVQDGIANIPPASSTVYGLVRPLSSYGVAAYDGGRIYIYKASEEELKASTNIYKAVVAANQHISAFYALAKAAGDTTQAQSDNAVGIYTDGAKASIQSMLGIDDLIASHETTQAANAYAVGECFIYQGKLYKATTPIAVGDAIAPNTNCIETSINDTFVKNTDYATANKAGLVQIGNGFYIDSNDPSVININYATSSEVKAGTAYAGIRAIHQHMSTFYGLAKAAGVDMKNSSNAVGTYTDAAKTAIQSMIGAEPAITISNITGTSVTINGVANTRYVCGEVADITITPPASGIIDIIFTSGTTPSVLSMPSTVKFPSWFNPSSLVASTTYEINIMDGIYGAVMAWT